MTGLFIIGSLYSNNVHLANQVATQAKQIEAYKVLVSDTEKQRDENAKKLDDLVAALKEWANNNQAALSVKQYSTFTDCNPRVGGGFSCFSY